MAMNAETLAAAIVSEVTAQCSAAHVESDELQKFATAVATAVVQHIQTNAVTTCGAGAGTVS